MAGEGVVAVAADAEVDEQERRHHRGVAENQAVAGADFVGEEKVAAHQDGACAHPHPGAQDAMRPDVGCGINLSRVGDYGARMDAARVFLRREEDGQHPGQGHPGVGNTNESFAG